MDSADDRLIELVVWETLERDLAIPRKKIHADADLIGDLNIDSDDLSFLFVPELEEKLGIKVPVEAWLNVETVQDAVNILKRYKSKK